MWRVVLANKKSLYLQPCEKQNNINHTITIIIQNAEQRICKSLLGVAYACVPVLFVVLVCNGTLQQQGC
jgi:hypothetical protein